MEDFGAPKRLRLAQLLQQRAERDQIVPMTYAQQGLWFLHKLDPTNSAYIIARAFLITGNLDREALCQSLNWLIQRHDSLRTTFAMHQGSPVQQIAANRTLELQGIDLSTMSVAPTMVESLLKSTLCGCFDLEKGPLLRAYIYQLGPNQQIFGLAIHHSIADGWSISILMRELASCYQASCAHILPTLPPLAHGYASYSLWQQQQTIEEAQLACWATQLAGPLPILQLPMAQARSMVKQTFQGQTAHFLIHDELTKDLKAFAHQEQASLFMILAATIKLLLYRYSNQTDMLIGTPVAGRLTTALESIVGFFANTLVLRTSLAGQPSFRELLQRLREVALAAYAHQALPFERLLQQLRPNRSQSHLPIFQVLVTLQNSPEATLQLGDTEIVPLEFERGTAKFDLSFVFTETTNGLAGTIEYNTDLFDSATIERMIAHLNNLFMASLSAPDLPIACLPLLTSAEYARFIEQSHGITRNFPSEIGVQTLFEQQVARTPHALAVVHGHVCLTYQSLDHQANQLAYYLAALGVKPSTCVGLCVERTPMMVIGMMGILKVGATYVPIDPSYPPERQAYMVANAGLVGLVTQGQAAISLQAQSPKLAIVALDTDWAAIEHAPRIKLPRIAADTILYSIYTSGSTGVPKGTEVTHRGFVNLLNWYITEFNLRSDERFLLMTSLSFDLTQKNIFAPLVSGGTLYLSDAAHYEPHAITTLIDQHAITVVNCTPSAFYPLVETKPEQALVHLKSLKWLFLGGEPINLSRLDAWMQSIHYQANIINTYGPTECTDIAASYRINPIEQLAEKPIPIGMPIYNTQLLILNDRLQPVPDECIGQIWISGAGVGNGYTGQPGLTAERFRPNPFDQQPGSRMYCSGDLGRRNRNGAIEFLGRTDHQVKIRGFRVELTEIEQRLQQHPAVRQALVMLHNHPLRGQYLIAYVVLMQRAQSDASALRRYLTKHSPHYLVPAEIMLLEAFPLSPNGKIDRQALPHPTANVHAGAASPPAARSFDPLEFQIRTIWEETLGIEPIGAQTNFFELGGHSLLAIALMARIEERLGKRLPITILFDAPTIEQMVGLIRQEGYAPQWSPLVLMQAGSIGFPALFCVHALSGSAFAYTVLPKHISPDQPFYGIESRGRDINQAPDRSIEAMAAYYIDHMQLIQPRGPYRIAGWSLGGPVAFEMAQQLYRAGETVALLAIIDTGAPLAGRLPIEPAAIDDLSLLVPRLRHFGIKLDLDFIQALPADQQLPYIMQQAVGGGFWSSNITLAEIKRKGELIRTNLAARRNYSAQPYPGTINLFRTKQHPGYSDDEVTLGWDQLALKGVKVWEISGDHLSIFHSPHVEVLGQTLWECLQGCTDQIDTLDYAHDSVSSTINADE